MFYVQDGYNLKFGVGILFLFLQQTKKENVCNLCEAGEGGLGRGHRLLVSCLVLQCTFLSFCSKGSYLFKALEKEKIDYA
jgi:hypothetical protein